MSDMSALTGAYVVNALTDREAAEFEQHLAGCEDCAREVRELRETTARLGTSVAATPPESLKHRVLTEIAHTRQEPPPPAEPPGHTEPPPPRTRASLGTRLAAVAAVIGVAAAAAFGALAWQTQQRLDRAQQRLERTDARGATMSELLRADDARIVTAGSHGMRATAVISHQLDQAMFIGAGIEQPPPGHAYQVWFIGPRGATSAGIIRQDRSGTMTPIMAPMPPNTSAIGVTVEPAGGSSRPTSDPMLTVRMPH